jgi:spore coat protein U-like protein
MSRHTQWLLLFALSCAAPVVLAATCSVSATPLSFGLVQGVIGRSSTSTATLSVTCQTRVATLISYSLVYAGAGPDNNRTMSNGAGEVAFQLYTSSNSVLPWSSSRPISDSYSLAAGASVTRSYRVYARVEPGREGTPGIYADLGQVQLFY